MPLSVSEKKLIKFEDVAAWIAGSQLFGFLRSSQALQQLGKVGSNTKGLACHVTGGGCCLLGKSDEFQTC